MKRYLLKTKLFLTIEEYDTLIKAIDYYNHASSVINYGEDIETCQTLHNKIIRNLETIE